MPNYQEHQSKHGLPSSKPATPSSHPAFKTDTIRLKKDITKEDNKRKSMFKNTKMPDIKGKAYTKSLDHSIAMKDTLSRARIPK